MDPPKKGLQGAYPHCRRPWSTILACTRAWDELEHGVRLLPLQRPLKIFSELTFYDDGFFYNCRSVCDIANRFVYTLIMAYVTNAFKLKPIKNTLLVVNCFCQLFQGVLCTSWL